MNNRFQFFTILFFSLLLGSCNITTGLEEPDMETIKVDGVWKSESGNLASNLRKQLQSRTLQIYQDFRYSLKDTDYAANVSLAEGVLEFENDLDLKGVFPVTIHQTYPTPITYQGIAEINMEVKPIEMTIEYVQVFPSQEVALAPPVAEEGFGSTENFNLGICNVQKFSIQ
ncbi:MAG: hypothetical protein R3E32_18400 [Chitinophagales bacterium]